MTKEEEEHPKWLDQEYKFNLTEREKKDYEKMFLDIPPLDLEWLIGAVLYARAKQNRKDQPLEFKICDACMFTHPLYTLTCRGCLSDKLRVFTIKPNHSALLDASR